MSAPPLRLIDGGRPVPSGDAPVAGRRAVTDDERESDRAIGAPMAMILAGVFVLGLVVGQLGR